MSAIDRITMSSDACGGRPCIRGLRVRVKDVLDLLACGATREEILADYPYLEPDDITAARLTLFRTSSSGPSKYFGSSPRARAFSRKRSVSSKL